MAYETVIANTHYIFPIVIPTTFTLVSDIMTPQQLAQFQYYEVLDGYIFATNSWDIAHDPTLTVGTFETYASGVNSYFPFLNWHQKVYVRSLSGPTTATMKIVIGFERKGP